MCISWKHFFLVHLIKFNSFEARLKGMLNIAVQLQQATESIACFRGYIGGVFCISSKSHESQKLYLD